MSVGPAKKPHQLYNHGGYVTGIFQRRLVEGRPEWKKVEDNRLPAWAEGRPPNETLDNIVHGEPESDCRLESIEKRERHQGYEVFWRFSGKTAEMWRNVPRKHDFGG
jgi:hypothetical protein